MKYKDVIKNSMEELSKDEKVVFIGYNLKHGSKGYGSLKDVPEASILETPVAENLMAGLATGMAMEGLKPVLIFERHDFMLNASDCLINYLNKIKILSEEQYKAPMIIRAVIGSMVPINPGPQHSEDFSEFFKSKFTFPVFDPQNVSELKHAYEYAKQFKTPCMIIERRDLYEEEESTGANMTGVYSNQKIAFHPDKLKSLAEGKITAPLYVRIKPTNKCNHRCFYCLTKGTMILTPKGSVPIETLKKGDLIISGNKKVRKVKEVFKRKSKQILKIDVSYLPTIYASPEHPFLIGDKFIEAKDLKKGMNLKVAQPILNSKSSGGRPLEILYLSKMFKEKRYHSKRRNGPYDEVGRFRLKGSKYSAPQKMLLDYDFGRFCGLYLAEGNINSPKNRPNSKTIWLTFNKKEKNYIDFVEKFCNFYGFKYSDTKYDKSTGWSIIIQNSIFSIFIEKYFGSKGRNMRIPFEINMNHQFLKGLLRGFFDGDGCAKDYSMTSVNKVLIYGIFQLLLTQGIIPTFYKKKAGVYNIEGRRGKSKESYLLRISTKQRKIFKHVLDKNTKPLYYSRIKPYYVKINSVELLNKPTEVFNIEVEKDNTYFAEFLLCHNCSYDPDFGYLLSEKKYILDEIPREKMMEILSNLKEIGVKAITYSGGGEPLVYPYIEEALQKNIDDGIDISIITNGQALNGKKAELLSKAKWVRVSADSCTSEVFKEIRRISENAFYDLERNLRNFAKIKNKDCEFGINFVINEKNAGQVLDSAKYFKNLGLNHIRFSPVFIPEGYEHCPEGSAKYHEPFRESVKAQIEKAKELQDENFKVYDFYDTDFGSSLVCKRKYPKCFMMQVTPVIAANSSVYFCHDKAYSDTGLLGSIKNQSFKQLWFSPETKKIFDNFNPIEGCQHHCTADSRNIAIQEMISDIDNLKSYIPVSDKHKNFV